MFTRIYVKVQICAVKNVHLRYIQKVICASANMRLCAQKLQGRDACLEYVHNVE